MTCQTCPTPVPVVSNGLAARIVSMVPEKKRLKVMVRALSWLVTKHEGLTLYHGVNGRNYTDEEKRAIAKEFAAVEGTACPFMDGETCILDRLPPEYNMVSETAKGPYLWLPTAMAKLIDKDTLREVVKRREIADAKVAMLSRNEALY